MVGSDFHPNGRTNEVLTVMLGISPSTIVEVSQTIAGGDDHGIAVNSHIVDKAPFTFRIIVVGRSSTFDEGHRIVIGVQFVKT